MHTGNKIIRYRCKHYLDEATEVDAAHSLTAGARNPCNTLGSEQQCPYCNGEVKIVATITDLEVRNALR